VMQRIADAVMAASTALPPLRNTSMAASVARGDDVAAMPLVPKAGDLPGLSKFLIFHRPAGIVSRMSQAAWHLSDRYCKKVPLTSCRKLACLPIGDGHLGRNVYFPAMNYSFLTVRTS